MGRLRELLTNGHSRQQQFLELYRKHVHLTQDGAAVLSAALTGKMGFENGLTRIETLEHAGDAIVRQTHELLDRSAIPPFNRDHIVTLSKELDDVLDSMKTALRTVKRYGVSHGPMRPEAAEFCDMISRATAQLVELFDAFPSIAAPELANKIRVIDQLEDQADDLLDRAISDIFGSAEDRIVRVEMVAWREIFSRLEETTDSCYHAAQVLSSMSRLA